MRKTLLSLFVFFITLTPPGFALASETGKALKSVDISLDRATLREGLQVFMDVCMGCHSARYITYKNLMDYPQIALTREQVDELRGDKALNAALLTELSSEDAEAGYGTIPPDLSLMARIKRGGGAYIYSLMTGYESDPKERVDDGNYNPYFAGGQTAMSDPLGWLDHDPADRADLQSQARAVASFLVFIGDPHQLERKAIGKWVIIFLILLTLILYLLKREVWKGIKEEGD